MKNQSVTSEIPDKLVLTPKQRTQLIKHSRDRAPVEACGLISGRDEKAQTIHRMTNSDDSAEHYMMEPKEQFEVFKQLRDQPEELISIYHSHPATEAYPSEEDKRLAFYPTVIYLIISLAGESPELRGFRIDEDEVEEVPVITE